MAEKAKYDEEQEISSFWSWMIIILFSGSIMIFGWIVYLVVPDGTRQWNFGQLRDAPAESIYSTEEPGKVIKLQRQVPMLPEAQRQSGVPAERKPGGRR